MSSGLACTYAALLLFDSNKTITASDVLAVTSAAKITVPKFHAEVFAANLDKDTLTTLITSLSTPGAGASGSSDVKKEEKKAEPKKEEKKPEPKKEEKKEESDDGGGMGMSMFGDDD